MAIINGSNFNDNNTVNGFPFIFRPALVGTNLNDTIRGFNGNDIIFGLAGHDWIDGGLGNDVIHGQDGNDVIYGQAGEDRIYGGAGNDFISGGSGDDYQNGGAGIDTIDYTHWNGGGTYNLATGLASFVGFYTEEIIDFENINTGDGADLITGTVDRNVIRSGAGNDTVYGGSGDDFISGQDGNDVLYGQLGEDRIYGGAGNDFISGGSGDDYHNGGLGTDTIDYTHWNSGGTYNLNSELASFTGFYTEEIIDFENINTGDGVDWIIGTVDRNVIRSGDGNDWVSAGGGNDIVNAGAGDDTVYGSTGDDLLNGGTGNDVIVGGMGNNTLISGSTTDRDIFRYNSISEQQDSILDFDTAGAFQDVIQVRNVGFNPTGGAVDLFNGVLPANRLANGAANLGVRSGFRYFQGSGNLYFDSNGGGVAGSQLLANINGAAGGMAPPSLAQMQGNIQVI